MKRTFKHLLIQGLEEFSVRLSEQQVNQFYEYYQLLLKWNEVMNLTAITELEEVITKHFVDSLAFVKVVDLGKLDGMKVLDMGTGAGFPGVPLKIAFPHVKIVLMDSLNKRIKFLNEVIEHLSLSDINAVHGRAEDYGRDESYREKFGLCVSRAVAHLSTLSEYCLPFVEIGGFFVAYKSGNAGEEIRQSKGALKLLGGRVDSVSEFLLPDSEIGRTLVRIKKIEGTSKKYPRKAGMPGKEPLH